MVLNALLLWKLRGMAATLWGVVKDFRDSWGLTWGRGSRISEEWLRDQLVPLGFDSPDEQTAAYVATCVESLGLHGMFWEGQAKRYFADKRLRQDLETIYQNRVQRVGRLDASGYTYWGPFLYKAHPLVRDDAKAHLGEYLRKSDEADRARRAKGWQ